MNSITLHDLHDTPLVCAFISNLVLQMKFYVCFGGTFVREKIYTSIGVLFVLPVNFIAFTTSRVHRSRRFSNLICNHLWADGSGSAGVLCGGCVGGLLSACSSALQAR